MQKKFIDYWNNYYGINGIGINDPRKVARGRRKVESEAADPDPDIDDDDDMGCPKTGVSPCPQSGEKRKWDGSDNDSELESETKRQKIKLEKIVDVDFVTRYMCEIVRKVHEDRFAQGGGAHQYGCMDGRDIDSFQSLLCDYLFSPTFNTIQKPYLAIEEIVDGKRPKKVRFEDWSENWERLSNSMKRKPIITKEMYRKCDPTYLRSEGRESDPEWDVIPSKICRYIEEDEDTNKVCGEQTRRKRDTTEKWVEEDCEDLCRECPAECGDRPETQSDEEEDIEGNDEGESVDDLDPSEGGGGVSPGGALGSAVGGALASALGVALGTALGGSLGGAVVGTLGGALGGTLGSALGGAGVLGGASGGAMGSAVGGAVGGGCGGGLGGTGILSGALCGALGSVLGGAVGGAIGGPLGGILGGAGTLGGTLGVTLGGIGALGGALGANCLGGKAALGSALGGSLGGGLGGALGGALGDGLEGGQIIWENFNALGEEIGARFESELGNVEGLGKNVQEMLEDKLKEVYGDVIAVDVEGFGENIAAMFEDKLREIYGDISDDFEELGEVIVSEVQNEWAKVETEWPKMCGGE